MLRSQASNRRDSGTVERLLALVVLIPARLRQSDKVGAARPFFVDLLSDPFQRHPRMEADADGPNGPPDLFV
jgi:hypothetical protein